MESSFSDATIMARSQKQSHCIYFITYSLYSCNSVIVIYHYLASLHFCNTSFAPTWHKSLLWWQNPHCIHPVNGINFRFQRPLERTGVFPYQDEDITQVSRKSIHHDKTHLSTIFQDFIFSYWGMIPFYVLWDSITLIRLVVASTPSQTWRQSIPGSRQIRTIARWPCCNEDATQKAKNIWHHSCQHVYICIFI